ncbi:MAG TPA: hypothetical protein VMK12_31175 [Anaeromyxobacteraceae bacterium]|nr:hypothetical protein [Anaeromyxobacteraceae bacterium]
MRAVLLALLASLRAGFRARVALQLEVLALRHQLAVYQRRCLVPEDDRQQEPVIIGSWLIARGGSWGDPKRRPAG